jgi:FtsP/CotA-like multicopper oxidase with cupredoxin domain
VTTDALLIGMGERYDVLVTVGDGVFPLVALAEGKQENAFALVRSAAGTPPAASARPAELTGKLTLGTDLRGRGPRIPSGSKPGMWTGGMTWC